jgi:predicted ATP-dependent endonuclease of OLD family
MKIKTVNIQGFRSIKEPLQLQLEQVNALIGANNCGKSNILSAIYRVLAEIGLQKIALMILTFIIKITIQTSSLILNLKNHSI